MYGMLQPWFTIWSGWIPATTGQLEYQMLHRIRELPRHLARLFNRAAFHLLFTRIPAQGDYCNSKRISVVKDRGFAAPDREYLVWIRCGAMHRLIDDGAKRCFDIALNAYAAPGGQTHEACDYLIAGGLNKFQAAQQFIDGDILARYKGFIFLDDDVEITISRLDGFLRYCAVQGFLLAQPSLTRDSYYSHEDLVNRADTGWRQVDMVEVMCPYFSREALECALHTFDLSYSTWGLDYVWPTLLDATPAVVDAYTVRHTKPVSRDGDFYRYMAKIGISPQRELRKLKNRTVMNDRT